MTLCGPIKGVSYMTKSGNEGVFQKSNVENVGSSTEAHEFGIAWGFGLEQLMDIQKEILSAKDNQILCIQEELK